MRLFIFSKEEKQIEYECGHFHENPSIIIERMRNQENLQDEVIQILEEHVKTWGYKGFIVCDKTKLIKYGINEEFAKKLHAILFVYKKIQWRIIYESNYF